MNKLFFWIVSILIAVGLALSAFSHLSVCTQACAESHNYRLFHIKFEYIGFLFFGLAAVLHILSWNYPKLSYLTGLCFAGALGSEIWLIYLQKYVIKQWCPVCLSIAGTVALGSLAFLVSYIADFITFNRKGQKGALMNSFYKGITSLSVIILGLLASITGVAKFDQIQAAEESVKDSLAFGDLKSPIEVYLFTDWACPACRALEPEFEKMAPEIMKKARLTFVDHAIHPETLNYSPYNVSFMIKDKSKYFEIRDALTKMSAQTGAPTDEMVEEAVSPLDVKYQQLNFADVALSQKYFKQLAKQFSVEKTPTLIVINRQTKKGKKLIGGSEITEANVLKAIESLEQQK